MTWKAMSAQRTADIVDFWLAAGWPQTPAQVQQLGEGIGWTPDDDEMMENGADGLSEPAVAIVSMPTGETASLNFWVTDIVCDLGDQGEEFLDDQYALVVREGVRRWGEAVLSDSASRSAQWDHADGARTLVARSKRSVTVDFTTPQYAQVLREMGE